MTTTTKHEQAARKYLAAIIEDARDYVNEDGQYAHEDNREAFLHDVLSIEGVWKGRSRADAYLDVVDVTLATGGPAYGLEIEDGDVRFWYQGWFTPRIYPQLTTDETEVLVDAYGQLADWVDL